MSIQRFVHFEFPEGFSDQDAAAFEEIVSRWPEAMPWLLRVRCGRPKFTKPARNRVGYVLDLEFDDQAGFDRFTDDPAHLELTHFMAQRPYDVLIFDLDVDPPWR